VPNDFASGVGYAWAHWMPQASDVTEEQQERNRQYLEEFKRMCEEGPVAMPNQDYEEQRG
jgi:hypothetical protein